MDTGDQCMTELHAVEGVTAQMLAIQSCTFVNVYANIGSRISTSLI